MIRTLLTSTALVALLHTGAYAQETQTQTTTQPAQTETNQNVQTIEPGPIFNRDTKYERRVNEQGYFQSGEGQILASTLIGKAVYSGPNEDAERIGDVNDVVLGANGSADAVIIGVGGFLGLGEKDVAVDFSRVNWIDRDGDRWIVVEATKEDLEAAPAYDRSVTMPNRVSSVDQNAPATNNADNNQAVATDTNNTTTTTTTTAANQQPMTAPDRTKMKAVDMTAISADNLQGKRVYGANNEDIGEISDVLMTQDGKVDAFVVDVGGFLGMGEKSVAIGTQKIDFMSDEDGELVVFTPFTQEQLKASPEYSEQAYQTDRNSTVLMAP